MPGFDERYDPIYQRGHQGQASGTGQSARAAGNGQIRPSSGNNPSEQAAGSGQIAQPVPRPPDHTPFSRPDRFRRPLGPGREGALDGPGISEVAPAGDPAGSAEPAESAARKINPFLLALWLVGLVTLGLGIFSALVPLGLINTDQFDPGPDPSVWLFILPTLSPGFLGGGFACIGLALGLHALGWQRRR